MILPADEVTSTVEGIPESRQELICFGKAPFVTAFIKLNSSVTSATKTHEFGSIEPEEHLFRVAKVMEV